MPPALELLNLAADEGAAGVRTVVGEVQLKMTKNGVMAQMTYAFDGDAYKAFGLELYPFDVQLLQLQFSLGGLQKDDIAFTCSTKSTPKMRDTAWSLLEGSGGQGSAVNFEVDEGEKRGQYTLQMNVVAARHYSVHVYRVVLVMAIFSLGSITALIEDEDVSSVDRLSLTYVCR